MHELDCDNFGRHAFNFLLCNFGINFSFNFNFRIFSHGDILLCCIYRLDYCCLMLPNYDFLC